MELLLEIKNNNIIEKIKSISTSLQSHSNNNNTDIYKIPIDMNTLNTIKSISILIKETFSE
jgi:hypothetical protein